MGDEAGGWSLIYGGRMPDVSVVIPAYNPGPFINEAVDSVLAQDIDLEVIVVDDGGSEDLSRLASRVRLIRQSNGGVSVARNVGIAAATAPLIAFLDQDDVWLPGKLRRQLDILDGAEMSHTGFTWWWPDRGEERAQRKPDPITVESVTAGDHFLLSSLLVRRDWLVKVGGFLPVLRVQQDSELAIRLVSAGARCTVVPDPLVRYRLHGSNGSGDYERAMRERLWVLREQELLGHDVTGLAAQARRLYGSEAWQAFRHERLPRHALNAVRWNPSNVVEGLRATIARRVRG